MELGRFGLGYEPQHRHGSGEWAPMREHHDAAEHDPERGWLRGRRIFRCDCGDEIALTIPDDDARDRPNR